MSRLRRGCGSASSSSSSSSALRFGCASARQGRLRVARWSGWSCRRLGGLDMACGWVGWRWPGLAGGSSMSRGDGRWSDGSLPTVNGSADDRQRFAMRPSTLSRRVRDRQGFGGPELRAMANASSGPPPAPHGGVLPPCRSAAGDWSRQGVAARSSCLTGVDVCLQAKHRMHRVMRRPTATRLNVCRTVRGV